MKDIKISNLLDKLIESDKDKYDFNDIVDLDNALNRHLHIGEIDALVGDSVDSYIRFFNKQDDEDNIPIEERKPIKIFIDSPGGDLIATFTMINAIKLSKTPVHTINIGAAYSGGFFIFLAGHKRFAYELSSFLFHEGSTGTSGDAGKFRNFADFYKKELDKLKSIVLKYTKISDEEYEKHIKDDWWFTAEEAIEYGICDEILTELIY